MVHESEYHTAYEPRFQVRAPAPLHERLQAWVWAREIKVEALVLEILEEAVHRRGGQEENV